MTARNNLPYQIAWLAEARGRAVEHRLIQAGGTSLRTHRNAGQAVEAIRDGGYDVVVLQERSTLPVKNAVRMHENVRLFDGVIRAAGATGAQSHPTVAGSYLAACVFLAALFGENPVGWMLTCPAGRGPG